MIPALIAGGAGLLGGLLNRSSAAEAQQKNYESQKEFAQQGIRWKVEDAKAAGIHPLAALGASTASFSPSYVGDTSVGASLADAGQDISRAMDATRTSTQKVDAYSKTVQDLQVTRLGLENELLAAKIRVTNQAGQPPAFPTVGPIVPPPGANTAPGADVGGQTLPIGNFNWKTSPWATAEEWERQYGDVGQNIYGGARMVLDGARAVHDLAGNSWQKHQPYGPLPYILQELFGVKPAY